MRRAADCSGDAIANIGRDYANTGYEMPGEKVVNQEFRLLGIFDCCLAQADNRHCQQRDFHGRLGFGRRAESDGAAFLFNGFKCGSVIPAQAGIYLTQLDSGASRNDENRAT